MYISINSKIVHEKDATINVLDHGLLLGDGIFETLRTYNGKLFKFNEHYKRLKDSAKQILLPVKISKKKLQTDIQKLIKKNNHKESRIRITITRGIGPLGPSIKCTNQKIIIITTEQKKINLEKGVKILTYDLERNMPTVKSLSYLPSVISFNFAKRAKAFECLLVDKKGYVTEGSLSNYFIVKNKTIITPKNNILKGITRNIVIGLIKKRKIRFIQKDIKKQELLSADEIFLTFTSAGIVPIIKVNNKVKKKGPTTTQLLGDYKEYIKAI